jgi:hypothetical protein
MTFQTNRRKTKTNNFVRSRVRGASLPAYTNVQTCTKTKRDKTPLKLNFIYFFRARPSFALANPLFPDPYCFPAGRFNARFNRLAGGCSVRVDLQYMYTNGGISRIKVFVTKRIFRETGWLQNTPGRALDIAAMVLSNGTFL